LGNLGEDSRRWGGEGEAAGDFRPVERGRGACRGRGLVPEEREEKPLKWLGRSPQGVKRPRIFPSCTGVPEMLKETALVSDV
jgi:hypothetical protein